MPIYSYRCLDCGEVAEFIQKLSEAPMTKCEECGGRLEKQISVASFHLKGGGWYKDGYASAKGDDGGAKPGKGNESTGSAGKEAQTPAQGKDGGSGAKDGSASSGDSGGAGKGESKSKGKGKGKGKKAS